jgi:hypothetical protein
MNIILLIAFLMSLMTGAPLPTPPVAASAAARGLRPARSLRRSCSTAGIPRMLRQAWQPIPPGLDL